MVEHGNEAERKMLPVSQGFNIFINLQRIVTNSIGLKAHNTFRCYGNLLSNQKARKLICLKNHKMGNIEAKCTKP